MTVHSVAKILMFVLFRNAAIGPNAIIGSKCKISDNVRIKKSAIGNNCSIWENVLIENCQIGNNVTILVRYVLARKAIQDSLNVGGPLIVITCSSLNS